MFLLFPSSSDNHQSMRTTTLEHRPALVFQVNDFRHNKPGGKSVVHYPGPLGCFRCNIFFLVFQECEYMVYKVTGIGRGSQNFMPRNTSCTLSFEIELWDFGVLLIRLQIYVFSGDILACKEAVFSFPCQIYLLWQLPSLFFC